jgi:uncharacterized membrane protein (UPF0127 family)
MANTTASTSFRDRIQWDQRIKPALVVIVIAAITYAIGAFVVGPRNAQALPTHIPSAFAALPTGSVLLINPDGDTALLPVRVADTTTARSLGFRDVGEQALDNAFLLYPLPRETTARTSYSVEGARAPIEFAAIDATGTVVALESSALGATRVSIAERHQWVIAAKAGTLERFGVTVGSTLDPERVRRF